MLREHRWPDGVKCPYCGSSNVIRYGRARSKPYVQRYRCKACGKQFSDLTGTPFAWTELPPSEVLTIAYLYFKLGMSQLAIARETSRSRKAVRRQSGSSAGRLRTGFEALRLKGKVEVDEAYMPLGFKGQRRARPRRRDGGRRRGRCTGRKRPFFTLVERGPRKAFFLAEGNASCRTVATVLLRHLERGSTVYTDSFRGYRRVSGLGYEHLSMGALLRRVCCRACAREQC